MLPGDRRLPSVLLVTAIYVLGTLAIFNLTYGLVLALVTTSICRGCRPSSAPFGCYRG